MYNDNGLKAERAIVNGLCRILSRHRNNKKDYNDVMNILDNLYELRGSSATKQQSANRKNKSDELKLFGEE